MHFPVAMARLIEFVNRARRKLGAIVHQAGQRQIRSSIRTAERAYAEHVTPGAQDPYHSVFPEFLKLCHAMSHPRILEIGAREVSGNSRKQFLPADADYVGFDIHSGPGVDTVGDAHKLGTIFEPCSFDAAMSFSVFEHLAFPWKAALEINSILKLGGICFVSTHPCWPAHELPWDFWRFPVNGLRLLFSASGFEIIAAKEGLPGRVHSLVSDEATRAIPYETLNLGVAIIAKKIADYDRSRLKWDIFLEEIEDTTYPIPPKTSTRIP